MDLSIIIATCDRPERLARALEAVGKASSAAQGGHSVIVVDNGPDSPAQEAVDRFASGAGVSVTCLKSSPCNKSVALNAGIAVAKSEWLAFTDDDALPDENWLVEASKYIAGNDVALFGGKVQAVDGGAPLPGWLKTGKAGRRPRGPAVVDYAPMAESGLLSESMQVPLGSNLFARKDLFDSCGGYSEELWQRCGRSALGSEDAEFGVRARNKGEAIGYCAEAVVLHPVYSDRAMIRKHLAWAWHAGRRESVLFAGTKDIPSKRFLARIALLSMCRGAKQSMTGDPAAAVCEWMEAMHCFGQLSEAKRNVQV